MNDGTCIYCGHYTDSSWAGAYCCEGCVMGAANRRKRIWSQIKAEEEIGGDWLEPEKGPSPEEVDHTIGDLQKMVKELENA